MKSKLLKKFLGILGYKAIDKTQIKNERIISDKSKLSINTILKNIFQQKQINNLIQIGANDGSSFDELNYYIKKFKINSLLVEPIKENFSLLKKNYEKLDFVKFENSAISINDEITYLFKVNEKYQQMYGSHIPAIPSFDKKHLIKHGVKNNHIIIEKVNTLTILDLINKHNINDLDLLFIDAEGYDGKIIYDFFLNVKFRPIIIFEYIHINNEFFSKLVKKLLEENYFYFSISENIICYPKEMDFTIKLN